MNTTTDDRNGPPTQRTMKRCEASVRTGVVSDTLDSKDALRDWLEQAACEQGTRWLKGYDDDGAIWGRFDSDGTLTTERDAVRQAEGERAAEHFAELRPVTFWAAYLFGREREVKLWRSDDGHWRVRYVTEPAAEGGGDRVYEHYFDEDHLLVGTYAKRIENAFTLLWEGRDQRRRLHAVPATLPLDEREREISEIPRLRVRTYLTDGPWHEPSLQRQAGLVDGDGNDLNAPEGPDTSSHI